MKNRRVLAIAAQVATVAALVFVVYSSLLRPGEPGPLRGIEAPGSEERIEAPEEAEPNPRSQNRGGDPEAGRPGRAGPGASPGGQGERGASPAGAPPSEAGAPGPPTPTQDQYGDAVDAVFGKIASGRTPGDP